MENIVTDRLIIRKFEPSDWQDLHEYLSDEEVVKFEPYGIYSENQAIEEAIRRSNNESFRAVCLKKDGKLIGNLYLDKGEFDTLELGYVFNGKFQGQWICYGGSKGVN